MGLPDSIRQVANRGGGAPLARLSARIIAVTSEQAKDFHTSRRKFLCVFRGITSGYALTNGTKFMENLRARSLTAYMQSGTGRLVEVA